MSEPPASGVSPLHLAALRSTAPEGALSPAAPAEEVTVENFRFMADMLPGWRLQRAREVETGGDVRLIQLTAVAELDVAQMLRIEVYETSSPDAAREALLHVLAGFQVDAAQRVNPSPAVGEIEAALGPNALVFTRGNLTAALTSIGAVPAPVQEVARLLDVEILRKPEPADDDLPAREVRSAASLRASFATEAPAPAAAPNSAAAARKAAPTLKTFRRQADAAVEIFAIAPDGAARRVAGGSADER